MFEEMLELLDEIGRDRLTFEKDDEKQALIFTVEGEDVPIPYDLINNDNVDCKQFLSDYFIKEDGEDGWTKEH